MERTRTTRRRDEDIKMADWTERLKRAAFLWPLLVAALAVLGFRWVSPDARTTVLEAQMRTVPDSIQAALVPVKNELAAIRRSDSLRRVADSLRDVQMDRFERLSRLQLVMQCRALSPTELDFVQSLEQVCDRNAQRAGLPYRRGSQ
jgi:hypothetical protein